MLYVFKFRMGKTCWIKQWIDIFFVEILCIYNEIDIFLFETHFISFILQI